MTNTTKNNYGYDIKSAASRLSWRFRKENDKNIPFTPNDTDVLSLNTLLEYINREKKQKLQHNVLFAKLFIYHLTAKIRENKTTIFDKIIQHDICRVLDYPLETFYEAFKNELYSNQIDEICTNLKDKETKESITADDFKELYTLEYITANLDLMITEALNRFER